ncbi:hypothetical protein CVT26_006043 [Gymnopilus dilepis]|uniref:Uncharacterized protein n=1 Tax=Gymnopilus dilepis TaxID=231916 RepID=A0A409VQI4_9AGAR|nr:hypothetical protein CVT26_006043 [Gymnopilus dilepis]
MSSSPDAPKSQKRKWDQPAPGDDPSSSSFSPPGASSNKVAKTDDAKSASEAAAAAAAIAAKIAAQFANGMLGGDTKENDGEFTHNIDINDVRNRYLLTKGSTQEQIHEETGASVNTRGTWYPDRSKATEKDPPLYIHISAKSKEMLDRAIAKINELISMDIGSLVEKGDKNKVRWLESVLLRMGTVMLIVSALQRKWPEEKLPVGLESIRNFNIRAKVVGPGGSFVKYIQAETSTRVQIKGLGSGFIDQETGQEEPVPLYIHITGPEEGQVARAKVLTEDLLLVVRQEHAKQQVLIQQQQMELHQAQAQYAAYSQMGYAPPPPAAPAPPPPPGEGPPPPPSGTPAGDAAAQYAAAGPPAPSDTEAYAAYWAAYGYDVNSPEFKEWQASQQAQYAQYYAAYAASAQAGGGGMTPGGSAAPPPPGAAPPSEAPPPPPPPPS